MLQFLLIMFPYRVVSPRKADRQLWAEGGGLSFKRGFLNSNMFIAVLIIGTAVSLKISPHSLSSATFFLIDFFTQGFDYFLVQASSGLVFVHYNRLSPRPDWEWWEPSRRFASRNWLYFDDRLILRKNMPHPNSVEQFWMLRYWRRKARTPEQKQFVTPVKRVYSLMRRGGHIWFLEAGAFGRRPTELDELWYFQMWRQQSRPQEFPTPPSDAFWSRYDYICDLEDEQPRKHRFYKISDDEWKGNTWDPHYGWHTYFCLPQGASWHRRHSRWRRRWLHGPRRVMRLKQFFSHTWSGQEFSWWGLDGTRRGVRRRLRKRMRRAVARIRRSLLRARFFWRLRWFFFRPFLLVWAWVKSCLGQQNYKKLYNHQVPLQAVARLNKFYIRGENFYEGDLTPNFSYHNIFIAPRLASVVSKRRRALDRSIWRFEKNFGTYRTALKWRNMFWRKQRTFGKFHVRRWRTFMQTYKFLYSNLRTLKKQIRSTRYVGSAKRRHRRSVMWRLRGYGNVWQSSQNWQKVAWKSMWYKPKPLYWNDIRLLRVFFIILFLIFYWGWFYEEFYDWGLWSALAFGIWWRLWKDATTPADCWKWDLRNGYWTKRMLLAWFIWIPIYLWLPFTG